MSKTLESYAQRKEACCAIFTRELSLINEFLLEQEELLSAFKGGTPECDVAEETLEELTHVQLDAADNVCILSVEQRILQSYVQLFQDGKSKLSLDHLHEMDDFMQDGDLYDDAEQIIEELFEAHDVRLGSPTHRTYLTVREILKFAAKTWDEEKRRAATSKMNVFLYLCVFRRALDEYRNKLF